MTIDLQTIPSNIIKPNYDRKSLTAGIVHVGVGNFHRAHQSWYLHRLMQQGEDFQWAILGAGIRDYDKAMRDRLIAQDCLTTLIELDPKGKSAEIVGSMIDYLPVEENHAALLDALCQPNIRIISMTVTEGGYYQLATGGLDINHLEIGHDIAYPNQPKTVFGLIVKALRIRRDEDIGAITCLSCDNIQNNGDVLKTCIVTLAEQTDIALAKWITDNCTFPNSMVDCIVPATGEREMALAESLGINDQAPVTHENFRQWVIEDAFCAGRPAWEKVGATFTHQVHDYEVMKLRILNGGHQIICGIGALLGIETIHETMAHPLIHALLKKILKEEIGIHVKPVPEYRVDDYIELIIKRFSNPEIHDTTRRVAFDGSSRHPVFLLPSIMQGLQKQKPVDGLALVEAFWARYCLGRCEDGTPIVANDPHWDALQIRAEKARQHPMHWLENDAVYGDLKTYNEFSTPFCRWMELIETHGCLAALKKYLNV